MKTFNLFAILCALTSAQAFAEKGDKEGPCKQVKEACESAGFVKGESKEGKGLWADCVNPLMQGTPNPKSKIALPSVSADTIAACKTKHPNFGTSKGKKAHS